MAILTNTQIKHGYYEAGVLPASDRWKSYVQLKDYKGEDKITVACTQLDYLFLTEREKKRILNEWIDFFKTNTKALKALNFCSRVPQALFDAACSQENLEELYLKWGTYKDLSPLRLLPKLKFLHVGSGAGVESLAPLDELKSLVVLSIENFKKIEDYSPLSDLDNLEQLYIHSSILVRIYMNDLEFLRDMQNLLSFGMGDVTFRNKYTKAELKKFAADLPNIHFINWE